MNMLLVFLVLAAVLLAQFYFYGKHVYRITDDALRRTLEWSENGPDRWQVGEEHIPLPPDGERLFMVPTFCVVVRSAGNTVIENNVEISAKDLEFALESALDSETDRGELPGLELRFLRAERDGELRVAFADAGWERDELRRQSLTSAGVLLLALTAFFPVSLFLSRLVMRSAEQSWKRQQQFIADASHELKTPLAVLLSDTDILLAHPDETVASQRKWVEYIREEGGRMKELVEDMLFLARGDSGADRDLPWTPAPLSDLCRNCQLSFEPVAFERGAELTADLAPGLNVPGNADQLRRLVTILLDNACKYCGDKGRVDMKLSRQGDRALLSVRNTGEPVPPEALPHLFERFYRADPSRARSSGGYGLGLSIAASVVERHKGRITVESTAENGTCFTVTLPLQQGG